MRDAGKMSLQCRRLAPCESRVPGGSRSGNAHHVSATFSKVPWHHQRMKKTVAASTPDAYVAALSGWQRKLVEQLRGAVRGTAKVDEVVKWGHLVYFSDGPMLLIRAEETRVLFGFWRGQRLRDIEPALKGGGKYEMATVELREGMSLPDAVIRRLTRAAVALNEELGDPTGVAKPSRRAPAKKTARKRAQRATRARGSRT